MAQYEIDNVPSPIDFQEDDEILRALQNAKNLLMGTMGEVPYDRYRGFDKGLYDLPMEEFENELLPELDRIMMWEPDVEVVDGEGKLLEDGSVYIKAIVEVTIDEEDEDE